MTATAPRQNQGVAGRGLIDEEREQTTGQHPQKHARQRAREQQDNGAAQSRTHQLIAPGTEGDADAQFAHAL